MLCKILFWVFVCVYHILSLVQPNVNWYVRIGENYTSIGYFEPAIIAQSNERHSDTLMVSLQMVTSTTEVFHCKCK